MIWKKLLRPSLICLSAGLILALSGCSVVSKMLPTPEPNPCPNPPQVDRLKLIDVEFIMSNDLVCLSPDAYGDLGDNMAEILKVIKQKNAQINYWRECR